MQDTLAAILHTSEPPKVQFRNNMVRAASTFDHEILFGVFCALTATILLYWERGILARSVSVGVCLLGCVLSLSSASLMVFGIAICVYAYDQLLNRYTWRWPAFWLLAGALTVVVVGVSNGSIGLDIDPPNAESRDRLFPLNDLGKRVDLHRSVSGPQ